MLTEAQLNANRENAKKSTGPRTPEGKAASSRNRLLHGLCAENHVLTGEDAADFISLCADLRSRFRPQGDAELRLLMRVAVAQWRLDRALPLETQIYSRHLAAINLPDPQTENLGIAFIRDSSNHQNLIKLARYETSLERSIARCLRQLADYQKARIASESAEPLPETAFSDLLPPENNEITAGSQPNGGIPTPANGGKAPANGGMPPTDPPPEPASSLLPPDVIARPTVDNFAPGPSEVSHITICGFRPREHSCLFVNDSAKLDGVLNIHLDGYLPEIGETFTILLALEVTGRFRVVQGWNIDATRHFEIDYTEDDVRLTVVAA